MPGLHGEITKIGPYKLSNYFVTSDGECLSKMIFNAFTKAIEE
jgi:hypothetical protein